MDNPLTPGGTRYGVPARRKEIASRLSEAYSRDMLDQREFERRLDRAEAAATIEELEALVADFGPEAISTSTAEESQRTMVSVLSGQTHILGPEDNGLRSFTALGDVRIDLRALRGSGRTLTLRVSGFLGDVGIRVPVGTKIIRRSRVFLGEYRHVFAKKAGQVRQIWDRLFGTQERLPESPFPPEGPPPTVVLEGVRVLGEVTIEEWAP